MYTGERRYDELEIPVTAPVPEEDSVFHAFSFIEMFRTKHNNILDVMSRKRNLVHRLG